MRLSKEQLNQEREEYIKDKKATNTAFILMFPALITSIIAVIWAPLYAGVITIALAIYQFLMTKKFIEDYYRK